MNQQSLPLATTAIDITRLVKFSPNPQPSSWQVYGGKQKWHGKVGSFIGVLEVLNSRAHGIVLQFEDGAIETFHPMDLMPHREAA
ncbi:MAG: hypothetical protein V4607_01900 [Pseudomonadota bacterium]